MRIHPCRLNGKYMIIVVTAAAAPYWEVEAVAMMPDSAPAGKVFACALAALLKELAAVAVRQAAVRKVESPEAVQTVVV